MSEAERAKFLVDHCTNGSSAEFAKTLNIEPSRLSRILHGKLRLNKLFDKIIMLYPQVNPQWLRTGEGYPGDLSVELVKQKYEKIIGEKDALIRTLQKIIEGRL